MITVHAQDNDGTSPNNELIYRIDNGARDKFRIDAHTGQINVESGASLDRDLYGNSYVLKVLGIDRGMFNKMDICSSYTCLH